MWTKSHLSSLFSAASPSTSEKKCLKLQNPNETPTEAKVRVGLILSIFSNLQTLDLLPPWRWTLDLTHLLFNSRQLSMSMDSEYFLQKIGTKETTWAHRRVRKCDVSVVIPMLMCFLFQKLLSMFESTILCLQIG